MLTENSKTGFILLAAVLFAVYCFVFGQSGVLERMRLQKERVLLQNEISALQNENRRLGALLEDHASGRLAKYECENAGYVAAGSKVYHFQNAPGMKDRQTKQANSRLFAIEHLRIAWISFSAIALAAFYIAVRRRKRLGTGSEQEIIDEADN